MSNDVSVISLSNRALLDIGCEKQRCSQCTPTAERLSVSVQGYLRRVIGNVMPQTRGKTASDNSSQKH